MRIPKLSHAGLAASQFQPREARRAIGRGARARRTSMGRQPRNANSPQPCPCRGRPGPTLSPVPVPSRAKAPRSLDWRLTIAALSVALPPIFVTLILVGWIAHDDRAAKSNMLIAEVHSLADAVTNQIDVYLAMAKDCRGSSLLINGDLDGIR